MFKLLGHTASIVDCQFVKGTPQIVSADTDGSVLGITGKAEGKQVMRNQKVPLIVRGDDGGPKNNIEDTAQIYTHINLKDKRIQKNLSDLQLMDALTGQLDRHLGNIFIDSKTGKVTGIDNDMAFALGKTVNNTNNT